MKKLIALFLCLMLVLPVAAALADDMTTEITLWTFPVGGFGDDEQVQTLIADFNAVYPNIKVNVEYLDYTNGDVQVTTAMEAKTTPDIIFEGPERLVAVYAAANALVPLDGRSHGRHQRRRSRCLQGRGRRVLRVSPVLHGPLHGHRQGCL